MSHVRTHVTPDGEAVGWDICGNPMCLRHTSITGLDDCPKHPVMPAYLNQSIGLKKKKD